jgi:signal transduction histidine kinase/integral membrane sensor domain MASE1/ActR/RegA family two-component response regulator/putative methionine-R-sulfoxide reductase with GAF domain
VSATATPPASTTPDSHRRQALLQQAGLLLAYLLSHAIAFLFLDPSKTIPAIWPASGIVLAALLLNPRRLWAGILAGAFAIDVVAGVLTGRLLTLTTGFALLGVAQTWLAAWLLFRWSGPRIRFQRVGETLALAAVAVVAVGTLGIPGIALILPFSLMPYGHLYVVWWLTNGLGILLVTPFIVVWSNTLERLPSSLQHRRMEAIALLAITSLAVWLTFGPLGRDYSSEPPLYVLFALVAWAASRFGQRGSTAIVGIIALATIAFSPHPTTPGSPESQVFTADFAMSQLFLAVASITGLLLAAGLAERKADADHLVASEARLRVLSDNLPDGMVYQIIIAPDGARRFLYVSAGIERLHGITVEAALRDSDLLYRQFLEEDRPSIAAAEAVAFRTLAPFQAIARARAADGQIRWRLLRSAPRRLPDGLVVWDGIETDITDQRRAEDELRRANRALRNITASNQAIAQATDEASLLATVCRIILQDGRYRLTWVGQLEADEAKTIRPIAQAGVDPGYADGLKVSWADVERGRGPVGVAARTGRPAVCHDFATDPRVALWRDCALQHGFRSCLALPLKSDNTVFATLAIYSPDIHAFDEAETRLLGELADDLAYGILALRARRHHDKAQSEVRQLLDEAERARRALLSILEDQKRTEDTLRLINSRYQRHEAALTTLTRTYALKPEILPSALENITRVVAHTLDVARVGIWTYNDTRGALVCSACVELDAVPPPPPDLQRAQHEIYFRAVDCANLIVAHDAITDPRTATLATAGVSSILDAPLHARGVPVGVLRCEHRGPMRSWTPDEQTFVVAVANLISLLSAQVEQQHLESQLRQNQKFEALGTLASGIAHDFNNILTAIVSFSEVARLENPGNSALQENLRQILSACNRAAELVRQIRSFSRKQKPERRALQLAPVVTEALQMLRSTLPTTIDIESSFDPRIPDVLADPGQIHQVLMNLGTNAAHAMQGKPGRLTVRLGLLHAVPGITKPHPDLRNLDYVTLSLLDTGHGMDEATRTRIFEPFFSTRGPAQNPGLGLSMVHSIVRDHEGVITVESEPGVGSAFHVFLPSANPTPSPPPLPVATSKPGHGETILFVDDEASVCEANRRLLTHLGFSPLTHTDPLKALEAFQADPDRFAAVITDLTMPRLTGLDLADRIQAIRPSTPVLLSTGFAGTLAEGALRERGIRSLLPKPVEIATLASALGRILDGNGHS